MTINELRKGDRIIVDGDPYFVMLVKHLHMGRGGAVVQTKLKNLRNGKILTRNFKSSDNIKEAGVDKMNAEFAYKRNKEYWFNEQGNKGNRFKLDEEIVGDHAIFLRPQMNVVALLFGGDDKKEIINIELPVKYEYEVTEAPPNIRGNTSQGGTKQVTIEGGTKINVPLFIETGDKIRVNTETGEYVERV